VIEFRVVGVPAPQGSKSAFVRGGRAIVVEGKGPGRVRHSDWRQAVATAARDHIAERGTESIAPRGPVSVTLVFSFPLPAGDPYRTRHTTRPDVDKLARSVLDSLVSVGMIADDSLVFELFCRKLYAHGEAPGCVIRVESCLDVEAGERAARKRAAAEARRGSRGAATA